MSPSDDPRTPDRYDPDRDAPDRHAPDRHAPDRRRFLVTLAKAGAAAPFVAAPFLAAPFLAAPLLTAPLLTAPFVSGAALAQMSHGQDADQAAMAMGAGHPIGPDLLPAADVPWQEGRCAFCGMTIATPDGGALPLGFRERTYAQLRLADDAGGGQRTLHFESVACLHNYAYATGVRDGYGATFYVANEGAPQAPRHGLMLSREATYLWAESLRVSMAARMAAYPNDDAAVSALGRLDAPGRHRFLDAVTIADLAPLPEMNLIALLARASGLLEG